MSSHAPCDDVSCSVKIRSRGKISIIGKSGSKAICSNSPRPSGLTFLATRFCQTIFTSFYELAPTWSRRGMVARLLGGG